MDISRTLLNGVLTLHVSGRLDAFWADTLMADIDQALRDGSHQILLDLERVDFISSTGLRVLLMAHQRLREIGGALGVSAASEAVRTVMDMAGLTEMHQSSAPQETGAIFTQSETMGMKTLTSVVDDKATMHLMPFIRPNWLQSPEVSPDRIYAAEPTLTALGVGILGDSRYDTGSMSPGETLCVCGAVLSSPSRPLAAPDILLAEQTYTPPFSLLTGIAWQGRYSHVMAFRPGDRDNATLSALASSVLQQADTPAVVLVMIAETAGLVGACVTQWPPVPANSHSKADAFRQWISFTPEPAHAQALTVCVGLFSRQPHPGLQVHDATAPVYGHCHAGVFSARAIPADAPPLDAWLHEICLEQRLQAVLHLYHDDREFDGAGQSEFHRGFIWYTPLTYIPEAAL